MEREGDGGRLRGGGGAAEKLIPSPELVKACLDAYEERKDARLLPPAMTGMSKQQVTQYFPFLLYLDPAGFKAALHRLLMPLPPSGLTPPHPVAALLVFPRACCLCAWDGWAQRHGQTYRVARPSYSDDVACDGL